MSWATYKLGDILKRKKEKVDIFSNKEYKLVTIKLHHQGITLRQETTGQNIKSNMYLVKDGDFILSGIDARNGAFGIVPQELNNAIVTNDFWCLEPQNDILRKDFFLFLTSTSFFDFICNQCSDGTTQRIRLQKDKFFNYRISLPPIKEQKKVVELLSKNKQLYQQLSSELSNQLDLVKQLRQSFLREAMQGRFDFAQQPNEKEETGAELLERIKAEKEQLIKAGKIKKQKPLPPIAEDEIPFEIPDNWVWCRIGNLCNIKSGKRIHASDYRKNGIPFLRSGEIGTLGRGEKITNPLFISKEKYQDIKAKFGIPQIGDILIACIGGSIGNTWVVDDREFYFKDGNLVLIEANQNICNIFLLYYLKSPFFWNNTILNATDSSYNALTIIKLDNAEFPLPPLPEQQRIVAKLDQLMAYCDSLEESIINSQAQNELLLQQILREALEPKEETKVVELPKPQELEETHFVKRKMLACYIINKSANDKQFGDTKFEKLLHLADYHILKRNFGQEYCKKAAGPYDNKFTVPFFTQTIQAGWFFKQSLGEMNRILPGENNIKSQKTYDYFTDEELNDINKLIETFKSFNYKIPEIISTLYAVWNNRIINKQPITNDLLKEDFLEWDEGKAQYVYPKDRVTPAIRWMKENNFVPDGWGKIIERPKSKNKRKT